MYKKKALIKGQNNTNSNIMNKEYKKRKNKTSLNLLKTLEKLSRIRGYCYARNSALVSFLYITERQIQKYLAQFREEGLIECFTVLVKGNWVRHIYLTELGKRTLKEHQKSSPPCAQKRENDENPIGKSSPQSEKSSPPVTNRYIYINNKQHVRARGIDKKLEAKKSAAKQRVVSSSTQRSSILPKIAQHFTILDQINIKESLKSYLSTKYTLPQIEKAIACYHACTTHIHNPYGFIVKAIEENWIPTGNDSQRLEIEEKAISTKCQCFKEKALQWLDIYKNRLPSSVNVGVYDNYVSISFNKPNGGRASMPLGYLEEGFPSIFETTLKNLCLSKTK